MITSAVQQSDSLINIHISILFPILFPCRFSKNDWESSLCYTVGFHWPAIPYTIVCICQPQTTSPSLLPNLSPLITIHLFSKSVSLFPLFKNVHLCFFLEFTCKWYNVMFVFVVKFFIIVDLQCSVSFYSIAKWPSYTYMYILILMLSSIMFHHKWLDTVPCTI